MVVTLLRRRNGEIHSEGLLFATSLVDPFNPRDFQAVLPKHLIHRMVDGEQIYQFFEAWDRAAKLTRGRAAFGVRQHFVASAEELATKSGKPGGIAAMRVVKRAARLRVAAKIWPLAVLTLPPKAR